jgi:hypothetical protein
MELTQSAKRVATVRRLGWLSVASMLALALVAPTSPALAAQGQSVDICHGTGSDSNPYIAESPSVQSQGATEGELTGGHSNHIGPVWFDGIEVEWGDIIPPYDYVRTDGSIFHFAGLNWTAEGQAIFNNECDIPVVTDPPPPTPTPTPFVATPTPFVATPTPFVATPTPFVATPTPFQSVQAETGTPSVTLPPTDAFTGTAAPSGDSWRMFLIAMAALLASVLVMTPAKATSRRR